MNKEETDLFIKDIEKTDGKKRMLLHACCGPCSSGVLDQLTDHFDITILYYNPNTYPYEEYMLRYDQLIKMKSKYDFNLMLEDYDESEFLTRTTGLEEEREHGKRCPICFELRMRYTAEKALKMHFDCFTTTLSVSPYKDAKTLNNIGEALERELGIKYYYSDFKKRDGYKNSIKNSKELSLYRQDYCGCRYSLKEREELRKQKEEAQNG